MDEEAQQRMQTPMSEEELAQLGGNEDEIFRRMQENPELAQRLENMSAQGEIQLLRGFNVGEYHFK